MRKNFYALFLLAFALFGVIFAQNIQISEIAFANLQKSQEVETPQYLQPNAFRILRQAGADGKIAISYIFPINGKLLQQQNFSQNEIQTYRFYLSTFVNALAKQNKNKATEGVSVSGCEYYADVDGLGFSIVFENSAAQNKFFGNDNAEDDPQQETLPSNIKASGFFIKRIAVSTTFPVSSQKAAQNLMEICNMAISSWCKDNNLSTERKNLALSNLQSSVFVYDFASTQSGLKSELMYDDQNFHHNVFIKSFEEIQQNNQITFHTTYVNTPVWYGTALLLVILAMLAAYFVKTKFSKKESCKKKNSQNKAKP